MVKEWTRDDLPTAAESVAAYLRGRGPSSSTTDMLSLPGLHGVLDAVVDRLNTHHPKTDDRCENCGVDEALKMVGELARAMRRVQSQRDEAERERDVAVARAEKAESERDHGLMEISEFREELAAAYARAEKAERERDEWKARAAPAVTREDVEAQLRIAYEFGNDPERRVEYGADNMCALFGVESGQATDPVEELAEKIETATRAAIRQVCADLTAVAPSLDPLAVEQAMEVTAASRKVAAHVLGQEGRHVDQ